MRMVARIGERQSHLVQTRGPCQPLAVSGRVQVELLADLVEEHQRQGGFGSAVLESANRLRAGAGRVRVLAIEDQFIEHATTREEQLASQGLDQAGIERAARRIVQRVQEA